MATRPPKYTSYAGAGTPGSKNGAHALLAKLFPASAEYPTMQAMQKAVTNGDDAAAQKVIITNSIAVVDATGVGGLQPSDGKQVGDLGMFPDGVALGFGDSPDVSTVAWKNPSDPANPYMPDVTSPTAGPGHIAGSDKTANPNIAVGDLPNDASSDAAGENIRNPKVAATKIYTRNLVSNNSEQTKGKSGGDT